MFTFAFKGGRHSHKAAAVTVCGNNIGNHRAALGDSTCFVQYNSIYIVGNLQRFTGFDKNTVFCAFACAHHNGNRCGETQCARAGNNQYGDTAGQRKLKASTCHKVPYQEGHKGDSHNHRHKNTCDFVSHFGNRGFGGRCFFNQTDNLAESGICAHLCGLHSDKACFVDGRTDYIVPCFLVNRDTFTCDSGLVHAGYAFQHNAVNRDVHTRFYQYDVPCHHILHRDCHFSAVSFHSGGFWSKVQQTGNSPAGFALAACFKEFAQSDKGKDCCTAFKIKVHVVFCHQRHITCAHTIAHAVDCKYTVSDSRCGAHSNKAVHIRCAVKQRGKAFFIIMFVYIHYRQTQQELCKCKGYCIFMACEP